MLALKDKWVWDFWFAVDNDEVHIFFLQAPRSLGDPERRHHHASIGHAVSRDYRTWTTLPDALHPGADGEWDDLATWTGSVIRDGTVWRMLYTGVCRDEGGCIQRIGLATSRDLLQWDKHPENPVLQADPRWYEMLTPGRWKDQSWRDPYLYRIDGQDGIYALITARSPLGPADGAGVIAQARSVDGVNWEVLPPLTAPGEFAQVEVPQPVRVGDRRMVLFSCLAGDHSKERRQRLGTPGASGTFAFVYDEQRQDYEATELPILSREGETLYAAKLVRGPGGEDALIAFRADGPDGFVGELTDPLPVMLDGRGKVGAVRG